MKDRHDLAVPESFVENALAHQSWHDQLRAKRRLATPEEEKEIRNVRNRIRRGVLPRLTSRKNLRTGKRRIEFVV